MYSQRFRDIAALFDADDEESSEVAAHAPYTASGAMDVMNYAGKELSSYLEKTTKAAVSSVSSAVTTTTATATHFQQRRQNQNQTTQYEDNDNEEGEEDNNNSDDLSTAAEPGRDSYYSPPPHRQNFAAMLRQQQQVNKQQQQQLKEQPKELVLNTTDSTDSCTLSRTMSSSGNSNGNDNRSNPTTMNIGNLSYELPSPDRSWVVTAQQQQQRQQQQQQQKVIVETNHLASPWLETKVTHTVTIPHNHQHYVVVTPQSTLSPSLPSPSLPSSSPQQSNSWRARQFKRTFRHRASIRRARTASNTSSNVSNSNNNNNNNTILPPPPQQQPQPQPQSQKQPQPQPNQNNNNNNNNINDSSFDSTNNNMMMVSLADDATDISSSSSSSSPPLTFSPVRNLRSIFEKKDIRDNDENHRVSSSLRSSQSPGPVILPIVRRRRAVVSPVISKEEEEENKEEADYDDTMASSSSSSSSSSVQHVAAAMEVSHDDEHDNHHQLQQQQQQASTLVSSSVQNLRKAIEIKKRRNSNSSSDSNSEDHDDFNDDAIAYPSSQQQHHHVIAYPSQQQQQQWNQHARRRPTTTTRIMESIPSHAEEEEDDDMQQQQQQQQSPLSHIVQQTSVTQSQVLVTAASTTWWIDMEDRVDRYHRSVLATQELISTSSSPVEDVQDLRCSYEEFAENQNQLGQVMAVSLYKGMSISKEKYEHELVNINDNHQRELQDLRNAHEREITDLRRQSNFNSTTANDRANLVANSQNHNHRNEAFRQRWKNRMNATINDNNDCDNDDDNDDDDAVNGRGGSPTEVASTILSNMSCRELSMDRYRSRLLNQMKNKPTTTTTNIPPRSSTAITNVSSGEGRMNTLDLVDNEEETTVPITTAATTTTSTVIEDDDDDDDDNSNNNSKDAIEIQRLLDELQIAERRQKLLEKQLQQAGVVLAEDIPYQLAKDKVTSISKRMNEIGSSNITIKDDPLKEKQLRQEYFQLEKDMSKYITALSLTDEYANERIQQEQQWEQTNMKENQIALEAIRSYMPVNIRRMTNDELSAPQEDGREGLSKDMIKKYRRTNVLQLLRVDPITISKWHPSTIEAYRVTGLTITERRALHHHLLKVGDIWNNKNQTITGIGGGDPMNNRKLTWYRTMRSNFKEALDRYKHHIATTTDGDRTDNHKCNMIGKQCPVRANISVDYFSQKGGGLGYPIHDIYEDPMIVVGGSNDQNKLQQKSPAEIIAEARGLRRSSNGESDNPYSPTTMTRTIIPKHKSTSAVPTILPTTKSLKKKKTTTATRQNKMPMSMLMKQISSNSSSSSSKNKPNGGLLAAIAARRID